MRRRRRIFKVAALTAAIAGALSATGATGAGLSSRSFDARILVRDNFFSPRSLTIEQDETVKWVWRGDNRHNVTFTRVPKGTAKKAVKSRRKGRWFRTFRKPGRYKYVCTLFAGMRGSITVEPVPDSSHAGPGSDR